MRPGTRPAPAPGSGSGSAGRPGTARTATNLLANSGAQVVGKAATLAWTLVAARELSTSGFGTFFYLLAVAQLLQAATKWGFDAVLVRRGAAAVERLPALLAQCLAWQLALGLPVMALAGAVLVATAGDPSEATAAAALLAAVALDGTGDTARAVGSARHRQAALAAAVSAQRLVTAGLAVVVLLAGGGLGGLALVVLAGSVVGAALHQVALRRGGVRLDRTAVDLRQLRGYARGTLFIGLSTLVLMALFRLDSLVVGVLRGSEEVAAYSAAYRFLETSLFLAFALKSVVFPMMSASGSLTGVARGWAAGVSAGAVVYVPLAVVLVVEAGDLVALVFGEPYRATSTLPLQLLAVTPVLYLGAFLAQSALQAVDRASGMLLAASTALAVNTGLNLALVPAYGAAAAAASTSVSYGVHAAVMLVVLRRSGVRPALVRPLLSPLLAAVPTATVLVLWDGPVLLELVVAALVQLAGWVLVVRKVDPEQLAVLTALRRRAA